MHGALVKKVPKFISKLWLDLYISSTCDDKESYLSVMIYGANVVCLNTAR